MMSSIETRDSWYFKKYEDAHDQAERLSLEVSTIYQVPSGRYRGYFELPKPISRRVLKQIPPDTAYAVVREDRGRLQFYTGKKSGILYSTSANDAKRFSSSMEALRSINFHKEPASLSVYKLKLSLTGSVVSAIKELGRR